MFECRNKPIIAKQDAGKDQTIKNGEIYFRYAGRTQKIRFSELEAIINQRIEINNKSWIDLVKKIGDSGPENAAILDTEKQLIEKNDSRILVLDDELAKKLSFIKKGEFVEEKGEKALQLVGDVVPVNQVEVVKKVKEDLIKRYPLSSMQVASEVQNKCPKCSRNEVWRIIKENDLKNNFDYSAYNFRTKEHEDRFKESGKIPTGTASIFKPEAVDLIETIWKQEQEKAGNKV